MHAHVFVPYIIGAIICVQIFFFIKNLKRMKQFSKIFAYDTSWRLGRNDQDLVDGVYGYGNSIFGAIMNSINKYLGNNAGSVIDFGLLKDAVDRHCDSAENEIATQTPTPLYWGLAGTMAGVILGLFDLIGSGAIQAMLSSSGENVGASSGEVANGISALLEGVAWAMLASIVGILLTTANSLLFKQCKLKEENGKNSFLAWMQSRLLPELPSDTSQALNNLVKNLNQFNNTFKENTSNLGNALQTVNEAYAIQAEVITAVHDMDVMKMATANVHVLEELKECTDKLEAFDEYLDNINGYTEAIHRFEAQFTEEADRLHVLEEIRDFFKRHKAEIARSTADADHALNGALLVLKEKSAENITALQNRFVEQSEHFKSIINQEKEAFTQFMDQMNAQFSAQISRMPQMAQQLEAISSIPERLDKLIDRVEKSNARLASDVTYAMQNSVHYDSNGTAIVTAPSMPDWMKKVAIGALVIIAAAGIFNVVTYFIPRQQQQEEEQVELWRLMPEPQEAEDTDINDVPAETPDTDIDARPAEEGDVVPVVQE